MPFSRIPRSSWTPTPWANGGGVTHELHRDGDPFDLRISVAIVGADGPFSHMPGIDRTIALLDGAGFTLGRWDGGVDRVTEIGQPLTFSGDEPIECRLLDGPTLDWNLMVRRTSRPHHATRVVAGSPRAIDAVAIFAIDAGATLDLVRLDAFDLTLLDGPTTLRGDGQRLLVVATGRHAPVGAAHAGPSPTRPR